MNKLALEIPLAQILFLVEAARDESLSIWSPRTAADWLAETW
jgi:hypothetical protein